MNAKPIRYGLALLGLGVFSLALAEQLGPAQQGAGDASALARDKGRLRILLDGQEVGSEEFEISPSPVPSGAEGGAGWVARGNAQVKSAGGASIRVRAEMKLGADCSPVSYEWSTQGASSSSATITFQNGVARMELRMQDAAPFSQDFFFNTPRVAILDNNLYHHYAVLACLYDWKAKGAQTVPVLIPQDLTPGSITLESAPYTGPAESAAAGWQVLRVRSADLELELVVDESRRLQRISVPSAKAEITRR